MGELFVYKKDVWEENLREMGFYLGKFIYILDAYDDLQKDKENNISEPCAFNRYKRTYDRSFGVWCNQCLDGLNTP